MRKITIAKWIVLAFAGVGILWLFLHPRAHGPVTIGERAPNFTIPGLKSDDVSLAQYRGKVVLVNLWAPR